MVEGRKVPTRGVNTFLRHCEEFIRTEGLLGRGERVIIAVSGGIDSMVLLNVMVALEKKYNLDIIVGHVNHELRGRESEGDQEFVEESAKRYGIRCIVARVATKEYANGMKLSIQDAARELRYTFLKELRHSSGANRIVTAHHADDNAETLLLHFMRGTGLQGLRGILPKRKDDQIIRPLLFARRSDIAEYARLKRLKFREDSSNNKDKYTRNVLRHKVLPILEQYINPGIVRTLNINARLFEQTGRLIEQAYKTAVSECTRTHDDGTVSVRIKRLHDYPLEMQQALLHRLLSGLQGVPVNYKAVSQLIRLSDGQVGKRIQLNKRWKVVREQLELVISDIPSEEPIDLCIDSFGTLQAPGLKFTAERVSGNRDNYGQNKGKPGQTWKTTEFVDADMLRFPLRLRRWQNGDWFLPLGMTGKKNISHFLSDIHIQARHKKTVCVLCSGNDVVWVCGIRLDNRFKISEKTRNVARLFFHQKNLMTVTNE